MLILILVLLKTLISLIMILYSPCLWFWSRFRSIFWFPFKGLFLFFLQLFSHFQPLQIIFYPFLYKLTSLTHLLVWKGLLVDLRSKGTLLDLLILNFLFHCLYFLLSFVIPYIVSLRDLSQIFWVRSVRLRSWSWSKLSQVYILTFFQLFFLLFLPHHILVIDLSVLI